MVRKSSGSLLERWEDVVGYKGYYQVSSLGRVRGVDRVVKVVGHPVQVTRRNKARYLKPLVSTSGYLETKLTKGGIDKTHTVHALVAAAFLGKRKKGQEVRHLDGDRSNASLDNLSYGTSKENSLDAIRHGRTPRGEDCKQSVLSSRDVVGIRKMLKDGYSQYEIAKEYGVSRSCVLGIHLGNNWAWLK